jgi:tRNA (cytidine56-2'-O)-methyltransferase
MTRSITILRLGHRQSRDMRVTTHVALVARAFGAQAIVLTVDDKKFTDTINKVCTQFGGSLDISVKPKWRKFVSDWKKMGKVIHLTMYGEHIDDALVKLKKLDRSILIVVGAEKVPRDIYDLADYNIAVGNQPHSEIAALAVLMDRLTEGEGLRRKYDAEMIIEPNSAGKTVIRK